MHGSRSTYGKGCRCNLCREANRSYNAQLNRRRAELQFHPDRAYLIDASEVRKYIAHLRAHGLGRRQIADVAGVSTTVISRLLDIDNSRPAKRIRPEIASRILAVKPNQMAAGGMTSPVGTQRRLQALTAIGWSATDLAALLNTTKSNICQIMNRSTRIKVKTAEAVARLYDRLHLCPGASVRARLRAQRNGWVPPLAWDDIDLDVAPAQVLPDPELVDYQKLDMLLEGKHVETTLHERRVFISRLRDQGNSWYQIEQALNLTNNTARITWERYQKVIQKTNQKPTPKTLKSTKLKSSAQPS